MAIPLAVLFDTTPLDPENRAELWSEACDRIFFPMEVLAAGGDLAQSRIERHPLGPLTLFRLASDHGTAQRTVAGIRAHDPEFLLVATALRGRCLIEQGSRASVFSRGDLSSWVSSRPFRATHFDPFELLFLTVPRTVLGVRANSFPRRTAGRVPCGSPLGAITGVFLRQTWQALDAQRPPAGEGDLADAFVSLVRAVHSADTGPDGAGRQVSRAVLMIKIKAYIEAHLGDPSLGLESLAGAHYVSTRYIQKLFAGEGVTVSDWVRQRRLEACLRDLCDPALTHQTISEIARRWGLTNHAHFSRLFREAYGCTPRDLRQSAIGRDAEPSSLRTLVAGWRGKRVTDFD